MTKFEEISTRYLLPISHFDWPKLLHDWKDLVPANSVPWALSKFGELFLRQNDNYIGMLQVSAFQFIVVAKDENDFYEWLDDPDKPNEWFLAALVDQLESLGRVLKPDYCYSFITPLGLGGKLALDNVMNIPVREHFGAWGKVFRQVKDLPDGTEVRLRPSK